MIMCILLGILIGHDFDKERNCTVTITDIHGTQHVIRGKADDY